MAKCHWQAPEGVWAAVVALQEGLVFLLKEERRPLRGIGGKRPFRVWPRVDLGWVLTGFHNGDVGHLSVVRTLVKQILASSLWFASHLFTLHILFVILLVLRGCGDLCLQELFESVHISISIAILQVAST